MPKLARRIAKDEYKSIVQIPEVVGEVDAERVAVAVSRQCGAQRLSVEECMFKPGLWRRSEYEY